MLISIIAGILSNRYVQKEQQHKAIFSSTTPINTASSMSFSAVQMPKKETEGSCSEGECCCNSSYTKKERFSMVQSALNYSFGTLLKDIASPLLVGLLLGALITVAVPENLSEILVQYNWLSYIIVLAIAIPMYVCATASLPIAAGLMLAGVSPGAAFVFLSAGHATNTVTIGIVKKMLGSRTLFIYLGTIIMGSILFGFGLDYFLRDVNVKELVNIDEHASLIAWISTLILWGLVLYHIIKPYFVQEKECSDGSCCSN